MSLWDTIGEDYLRSLEKEPGGGFERDACKTFTLDQSAQYYREHYGVTALRGGDRGRRSTG